MYSRTLWSRGLLLTLAGTLPFVASCGSDSTRPNSGTVQDYITAVSTFNGSLTGTYHAGSPPAAGGGPTVTTESSGATILGGSKLVTVNSSTPYSTLIISVQGADGYYEIDGITAAAAALRSPADGGTAAVGTTSGSVVLTLSQTLPANSFTAQIAGGTSASDIGPYASVPLTITQVGTGDVQVSVSWDAPSDVDLHVVDPSGEEIYYANPSSASGGSLDLDSNAACDIDNKDNENITWPTGKAPRGTYTVRVDYFDGCGVSATNYIVTVHVTGKSPQTFSGSFNGSGDQGGAGAGKLITTFTF